MKSLEYLEEIKRDHLIDDEELADICCKLAYIARDNGEDDTILCTLEDRLYEAIEQKEALEERAPKM